MTPATIGLAEIALESGYPERSIALLEPLARDAPSPEVHFLLARAWAGIDAARSLPLLERVFEASPEHRQAWELWIDIMVAAGREDQAVARLERAVAQSTSAGALHLVLGQLYVNRGSFGGAEKEFRLALQASGSNMNLTQRARYSLGFLLVTLGRISEGERLLREVLAEDGFYLPALTALGDLLLNTGRLEDAEPLVSRMREIDANHPESLVLHARCLLARKQAAEAVTVLTELIEKEPDYLQAHFFLGRALKVAGRVAEAKLRLELFQELKNKKRGESERYRGLPLERVP